VFSISTNIAAMDIYRYLALSTAAANQATERLSSGYRINTAADDPAGLAISVGLQDQIDGMTQAVQNGQDGIDVLQTAEGGLTQSTDILQQMLSLATEAANGGDQTPSTLSDLQTQLSQLKSELDRVATGTTFDGTTLLDGSYTGQTFQIGADAGDTTTISIGSATAQALGVAGVDVTSAGALYQAGTTSGPGTVTTTDATTSGPAVLTFTAQGTDTFSGGSATVAAFQNLSGTISFAGRAFDLSSVDYSGDTTAADALTTLNAAATTALGLTTDPFASGSATGLTFTVTDAVAGATGTGGAALSSSATDVSAATPVYANGTGAAAAITAIDDAITQVSDEQSVLGGAQNALQYQVDDLNGAISNTTVSQSTIRDADMAQESTNLAQAQLLEQADAQLLAQADAWPKTLFTFLMG
jgi:flagellin